MHNLEEFVLYFSFLLIRVQFSYIVTCIDFSNMYCHPCSSVHSESNDDDGEDSDNDDLFVNPNHQKPTNYVDTDSSEESNGDAEQ